jgi:hypothetical protein
MPPEEISSLFDSPKNRKMKLAINLDTLRFHATPSTATPLQALELKRGDTLPVELTFFNSTGPRPLAGDSGIKLGLKSKDDFSGEFLALCANWTNDADVYHGSLNLNTTEATEAIGTLPTLLCALEAAWQEEAGVEVSTFALPVLLHNDYLRGNEGIPEDAMPPYPASTDLLTKSGNLAGLASPASARTNLGAMAASLKGASNGVAELDAGGKVPASQLALVASQISDSTPAGRALLTAADAQAQAGLLAGHVVLNTNPPTSPTNFSMFSNNQPPATGTYQAVDEAFLYVFKAGWTAWKRTPIASW